MPRYVNLLVDKSFVQSLNKSESEWLFHTFQVVCPHVFFHEIVADIEKAKGAANDHGLHDVKLLAQKIDCAFLCHHEHWEWIVEHEFFNHPVIPDGRPLPEGMVRVPSDGGHGIFIDQTPLQRVLDRWRSGDFDANERKFATLWRQGVSRIDLEGRMRQSKIRKTIKDASAEELIRVAEHLVDHPATRFKNLDDLLKLAGITGNARKAAVSRWKVKNRQSLREYCPYGRYILIGAIFFDLGVATGLVGTRNSNLVDFEYFKFLPFSDFFASNDKLHAKLSETIYPNCGFVSGNKLKAALAELSKYYENISDELRALGSMTYAQFPPVELDNAVTKLFDAKLPDWRNAARKELANSKAKRDLPKTIPDELKKRFKELEKVSKTMDKDRNPIVPSDPEEH